MEIRGQGLMSEDGQGSSTSTEQIYVLHPNCAVDDF